MHISLVIPAYQASDFIEGSINDLLEYLESTKLNYELIIVDDGSTDNTLSILKKFEKHPRINVRSIFQNQGKFAAILIGVIEAKGDVIIFTDADLPYSLNSIKQAYELITIDGDPIVVGDRRLKESVVNLDIPLARRVASLLLSVIVALFVSRKAIDSQCGFKAFRGSIAKEIFPLLRYRCFAADIEILYIALKHDLPIRRIPVRLVNSQSYTVKILTHFEEFIFCILNLKLNWHLKRYTNLRLKKLAQEFKKS